MNQREKFHCDIHYLFILFIHPWSKHLHTYRGAAASVVHRWGAARAGSTAKKKNTWSCDAISVRRLSFPNLSHHGRSRVSILLLTVSTFIRSLCACSCVVSTIFERLRRHLFSLDVYFEGGWVRKLEWREFIFTWAERQLQHIRRNVLSMLGTISVLLKRADSFTHCWLTVIKL